MKFSITPPAGSRPAPRGGTELMFDRLKAGIDADLFDKVQIVLSQHQALDGRPSILWLHDLPNQPGPVSAIANGGWKRYDAIVFVSHWQREMFHLRYQDLPLSRTTVIYNGIEAPPPHTFPIEVPATFKLVYASTPHRGLALLPTILTNLNSNFPEFNFICDVFSSFKLYGRPEDDEHFTTVFQAVEDHPFMTYRGTVSNDELRAAFRESHVLVYPCIYQETFCLTMIEAMMEGMHVVAPAYGAIPEIGGQWVSSFPMIDDSNQFMQSMIASLAGVLTEWQDDPETTQHFRQSQSEYMRFAFDFDMQLPYWNHLFRHLAEKRNG